MFDSKNPVENSTKQTNVIYKREINNCNITSFTNSIKNASWDNVFIQENLTKSFNEFSKIFTTTYETNFPLLRQKHLKNNIDQGKSPWMTRCIIKSVMRKNKLYKSFLRNPSEKNKTKYKKYKNKLNHIIKMAKKIYYEEQLLKYKYDARMTWKTLNEIMNRNKVKKELPEEFIGNNPSELIKDPLNSGVASPSCLGGRSERRRREIL